MTVEHLNSGEILSQATIYNGVVNVCGLTADDRSLDAKGQTEEILAKIDDRLASCGTDKSKLLMATIYLTNMDDKSGMNEAWTAWLGDLERPARACVGTALGSADTLVEIVVSAAK
ncbi:MAG: RidA family protein [Alphaproteobacteria bacterium]|jgi:enamine deaminase RidA (YjgF/YER057c/UK114 family)|nr:RidA family protein [Alphaproteobacteria bacterium]